jgi:hypothetical protein
MYFKEIHINVHPSYIFIDKDLKQGTALAPLHFNFALKYVTKKA